MGKKNVKTNETGVRLAIDIGTELQIELQGAKSRFRSELAGMVPGRFVIAKMPEIVGPNFDENCQRYRGSDVIVRYLYRGTVFGFRAVMVGIISWPARLMFTGYPVKVEECNVRKEGRISCILPGKIQFGTQVFEVSILDLSPSGCQAAIMSPNFDISALAANLSKVEKLRIMFQLPGESKALVIPALRKNVRGDDFKLGVGVQFVNIGADVKLKINNFIATAMSLHRA